LGEECLQSRRGEAKKVKMNNAKIKNTYSLPLSLGRGLTAKQAG